MSSNPDKTVVFRWAGPGETPAVAEFYHRQGEMVSLYAGEQIVIVERAGDIIAAVRLCQEYGVTVFRTMHVAEEWRQQGIGRQMLRLAADWSGCQEAYCIPYRSLTAFYAEIGFRGIDGKAAPAHLGERLAKYRRDGHDAVLMRKTGQCRNNGASGDPVPAGGPEPLLVRSASIGEAGI